MVSVIIPLNSKWDAPFHHITFDCPCADLDDLLDHLEDVLWDDIFKLCASNAAAEEDNLGPLN